MRKIIVLMLFIHSLIPSNSYAVFQRLYLGFQGSDQVKLNLVMKEKALNQHNISLLDFTGLKFSSEFFSNDENLDALFGFQAQRTITDGVGFSLTKQTFDYGQLSFNTRYTHYDLSNWTQTNLSSNTAEQLYEIRHSLVYQYDFFNQSTQFQEDIIQAQKEIALQENFNKNEQDFLIFFQAYMEAKLAHFNVLLNESFVQSAKKRIRLLEQRLQRGLLKRVDYLQGEMTLDSQQIALEQVQLQRSEKVRQLEQLVKRKLDLSLLEKLYWSEEFILSEIPRSLEDLEVQSTSDYALGQKRLELLRAQIESETQRTGASLLFRAGLTTNSFDDSASTALDEATIQRLRNARQLSLTYTYPIGMDFAKERVKRKKIFLTQQSLELMMLKDQIQVTNTNLFQKLLSLKTVLMTQKRKIQLANQRLSQMNDLYEKGIRSLDDVILAEEALNQAKRERYTTMFELELSLAQYKLLHGDLKNHLDNYKD